MELWFASGARSGGSRALGRPGTGREAGAAADIVALADETSTDPESMLNRWILGLAVSHQASSG